MLEGIVLATQNTITISKMRMYFAIGRAQGNNSIKVLNRRRAIANAHKLVCKIEVSLHIVWIASYIRFVGIDCLLRLPRFVIRETQSETSGFKVRVDRYNSFEKRYCARMIAYML